MQVTPSEFEKLVERIDLNADGCLQFDEFAASLVDWQQVHAAKKLLLTLQSWWAPVLRFCLLP